MLLFLDIFLKKKEVRQTFFRFLNLLVNNAFRKPLYPTKNSSPPTPERANCYTLTLFNQFRYKTKYSIRVHTRLDQMRIMHLFKFLVLPLHHLIQVLYVVYGFVLQTVRLYTFRHIRFDRILLKNVCKSASGKDCLIKDTIAELSIPPLKKAPNGTSDIICNLTESRNSPVICSFISS